MVTTGSLTQTSTADFTWIGDSRCFLANDFPCDLGQANILVEQPRMTLAGIEFSMKKQTKVPPDGLHQELFADGTVSGEGRIKDGKRHGKWKFYLRNGQLKAQGKYVAGILDGHWEWWRENGQPLQSGAFRNGLQTGCWKRFFEDGQLWDEGTYDEGHKVGEWITYNKDGSEKQRKTFKVTK